VNAEEKTATVVYEGVRVNARVDNVPHDQIRVMLDDRLIPRHGLKVNERHLKRLLIGDFVNLDDGSGGVQELKVMENDPFACSLVLEGNKYVKYECIQSIVGATLHTPVVNMHQDQAVEERTERKERSKKSTARSTPSPTPAKKAKKDKPKKNPAKDVALGKPHGYDDPYEIETEEDAGNNLMLLSEVEKVQLAAALHTNEDDVEESDDVQGSIGGVEESGDVAVKGDVVENGGVGDANKNDNIIELLQNVLRNQEDIKNRLKNIEGAVEENRTAIRNVQIDIISLQLRPTMEEPLPTLHISSRDFSQPAASTPNATLSTINVDDVAMLNIADDMADESVARATGNPGAGTPAPTEKPAPQQTPAIAERPGPVQGGEPTPVPVPALAEVATPHKVRAHLTSSNIRDVVKQSRSQQNFAKNLFFAVYPREERVNRSVRGSLHKGVRSIPFDQDVQDWVRYKTLTQFPSNEDLEVQWNKCVSATNKALNEQVTRGSHQK